MKEIVPTQPAIVHNEQQAVLGLFQKYVVPSYGRFDLALSHGAGSHVWDVAGKRYLDLGGGIAVLFAILVAMAMWGREGDYRVLYANLSDKDGGAILAQLQQMQVPYKHADGGAAILVPADKVHDVRLKLASAGLPKGSVVGFELMDKSSIGQTQFNERLNFQRGLEGELTRTITAMSEVSSERRCNPANRAGTP